MEILSQTFEIRSGGSKSMPTFGVVVSVRTVDYHSTAIVVGAPGLPNVTKEFQLGDALLFETPTAGLVEVRLTELKPPAVDVLATKVSPRLGITAALRGNVPFVVEPCRMTAPHS
jgi:hypothetical protein